MEKFENSIIKYFATISLALLFCLFVVTMFYQNKALREAGELYKESKLVLRDIEKKHIELKNIFINQVPNLSEYSGLLKNVNSILYGKFDNPYSIILCISNKNNAYRNALSVDLMESFSSMKDLKTYILSDSKVNGTQYSGFYPESKWSFDNPILFIYRYKKLITLISLGNLDTIYQSEIIKDIISYEIN
ncbi:hypothetical protein ACFL6G_08665 [candidate division KSB1 bacterium]